MSTFPRFFGRSAATRALALAPIALVAVLPAAHAAPPVRALVTRAIAPPPAGADAIRVQIYGDKSGAKVQMRLLAPAQNGAISGALASKPVSVDWAGWKTVTFPFSEFQFTSDTNPEATQDGLSSKETIASSTGLQLTVVAANARLFLHDLQWTSAADDTARGVVDPLDKTSVGKWQAVGDADQVKAASVGVTQAPAAPDGKPSLQLIVRNPALNERQLNKPIADTRLKSQPATPFALYSRAAFDTIVPESVPGATELVAPQVSLTACADEIEPASLAVYTLKEIKDASLKVQGPLLSATRGALPATALDIRVVRVGKTLNAPQLLMKDDRQSLSGALPTVRLTGDVATDVPAETSKQFWITVKVPRNQQPGVYTGKLVFSGKGIKPTAVPLRIEVPALELRTAFLQYGIDISTHAAGQATPDTFAAYLTNIRDHNVRLVTLYDGPSDFATGLRAYKDANLSLTGPVIAAGLTEAEQIAAFEGQKTSAGLPSSFSIYYRVPSSAMSSGLAANYGKALSTVPGSLLIADIDSSASYKALATALDDKYGEKFAPVYPISSDYAQNLIGSSKRTTANRDYWTWNIPTQSPLRNRAFAGMLLYKTGPGLYGAFPGPYQSLPAGAEPFAAFAPGAEDADPATLPQMTTFPVQGGVLDTIQWEAVREGIDDIRYIGVLKSYARELKDAKRGKDAVALSEGYLAKIAATNPLAAPPATQQANRQGIMKESLKLKAILLGKAK